MNKFVVGLLVAIACGLIFLTVDAVSGKTTWNRCVVTGHDYKPGYTDFWTDTDGKMHSTYHDEEYHVICDDFDVSTSRRQFYSVTNGQSVIVRMRVGKYSGVSYFPSIITSLEK